MYAFIAVLVYLEFGTTKASLVLPISLIAPPPPPPPSLNLFGKLWKNLANASYKNSSNSSSKRLQFTKLMEF